VAKLLHGGPQGVHAEAILVDRHADDLPLVARRDHTGAQVARRLHQHDVAGIDQDLVEQVKGLDAAAGDHHRLWRRRHAFVPGQIGAEPLACLRQTGSRPVLQRDARRIQHHLPRDLAQTVGPKRRGVGQAAGKGDDVVASGQPE
jgi:hypothetical protein